MLFIKHFEQFNETYNFIEPIQLLNNFILLQDSHFLNYKALLIMDFY